MVQVPRDAFAPGRDGSVKTEVPLSFAQRKPGCYRVNCKPRTRETAPVLPHLIGRLEATRMEQSVSNNVPSE
jgi:hypothetical protein